MTWESVKYNRIVKGRYLVLKKIKKKKGYTSANYFLEKIAQNFIKENYKFTEISFELAYEHGELQLHSVLFPAIFKEVDVCFREMPTRRFGNGRGDMGRIDYYVKRMNHTYLIEVKHLKVNPESKSFKTVQTRWSQMIDQLEALETKHSKLGIFVIPFRIKGEFNDYDEVIWWDNYELKGYGKKIFNEISPKPDWCSIIQIRDNEYYPEWKDDNIYYPAIMIMVYEDI